MSECGLCCEKDAKIRELMSSLESKEREIAALKEKKVPGALSNDEIRRYGRQLILPEIGMRGQRCLKATSVLVVGAGGLGCPAALYLAAAGVGRLGVVDCDTVELNNLHRQIGHTELSVGERKSESLAAAIGRLNSSVKCSAYPFLLKSENVEMVVPNYDVVVDASDNVPTRYLLSDACVLFKKPLVSGSALRFEGQLTVYNDGSDSSPCYRCLHPNPPSPETTTNCSDGGVLGPVTGVIGSLQALEVVRIAVGLPPLFGNKLLHFDGECGSFRVFKLRGKNPACVICGESPKINKLVDYELFCGTSATDTIQNISLLPDACRISCGDYKKILDDQIIHLFVDVRAATELDICSFSHSMNIPFKELHLEDRLQSLRQRIQAQSHKVMYVMCRRGNDSQKAVSFLREHLLDTNIQCFDVIGGFEAWHHEIDSSFPLY